jgi:hypothetical protein
LQKAPVWLRLVRTGNNFTGFWAQDLGGGSHGPWNQIGGAATISMANTVFVGLGLTAHNNDGRINTSMFDYVTITGNTSAPLSPTLVRITDGDFGEASTVFTKNAISFNDFTTSFTYRVDPRSGAADGLSFIMQTDPRGASARGASGGGLGYTGISNSIAVKFDIWNSASHRSSTGIYFDGEPPDSVAGRARSIFMDTDPNNVINFNNGHVFRIDFAYDSTALVLTETVTDTVTNAKFSTSYNVDIPAHLGSNVGYVGFGGGTGGETAVQDVLSWTYHSGPAGGRDSSSQVIDPALLAGAASASGSFGADGAVALASLSQSMAAVWPLGVSDSLVDSTLLAGSPVISPVPIGDAGTRPIPSASAQPLSSELALPMQAIDQAFSSQELFGVL